MKQKREGSSGTAQSPELYEAVFYWLDCVERGGPFFVHFMKTVEPHYTAMALGDKRADIRKNDRDYRVGDYICSELYPYCKISCMHQITHVLTHHNFPDGLKPGWAMLSTKVLSGWLSKEPLDND